MQQVGIGALIIITLPDQARCFASNDLELQAPLDCGFIDAGYAKYKEVKVNYSGVHRVKFLLWSDGAWTAYAKIYKNGVPYGTERTHAGATQTLFTEDLNFSKGDLVQLYCHTDGANLGHVKSFVICGSVAFGSCLLDNAISGGDIGYIPQLNIGGG